MSEVQAFIFDMDDTIARTGPIWRHAEVTLLDAIGEKWTPELSAQYKGMNALDVAATIHRIVKPNTSLEQGQKLLRNTLLEEYRRRRIEPMPGAVDCVRRMRKLGKMALASGSPLSGIHEVLNQLGIHNEFDVILSSESVPRGKPHPDVFLAAANKLHVEPANCLVFEDSLIGAQAARAAGMRCFVVPTITHPEAFAELGTVLPDWNEVSSDLVCELCA
jgi:HAD superfamily hydrolase (TIGR01509 family)